MKEIDLAFLAAAGAKIQVAQQPVLAMAASEERAQAPHLILQEETYLIARAIRAA